MKHLLFDERKRIAFLLQCGMIVAQIARVLDRAASSIMREILNHRIDSMRGYGCSNRLCAKFDDCQRLSFGATEHKRLAKNQPKCFLS